MLRDAESTDSVCDRAACSLTYKQAQHTQRREEFHLDSSNLIQFIHTFPGDEFYYFRMRKKQYLDMSLTARGTDYLFICCHSTGEMP